MGRRKKEPASAHREHIACAAQTLFMKKGVAATSMDEIAKAAGYSKATLYVYFENKEEIVSLLTLESMQRLYRYILDAVDRPDTAKAKYDMICRGLVRYQEEFPFYFQMALDQINIDFENRPCLPEERETYQVGEEINVIMKSFLASGIKQGELRQDLEIMPVIFTFWGMLSGLIRLAANKEEYIKRAMGWPKAQFLEYGFQMLYRTITNVEK